MFKENLHSIVIRADFLSARLEIIRWGEGPWWPEKSQMRFVRLTDRPVQKGTRYRQEVLLPFAPTWNVEVEEVTENGITRRFLDGMFKGFETVSVLEQREGIKIDYRMHYEVQGLLNKLLWPLVFENMHNKNIKLILASLKNFLEKR